MSTDDVAGYRQIFIARCRKARAKSGLTQDEMAKLLGMPQDKYKQYETRSMLPHRFISAFCAITRVSEIWLLTGHNRQGSHRLHHAP